MYPGPEINIFSLKHIIGIKMVTRITPFYLTGYNVETTGRIFIFLIEIDSQENQLASGISIISLTYQLFSSYDEVS